METKNFISVLRGLFIGAMILFGILVLGQICVWNFGPKLSDDVTA